MARALELGYGARVLPGVGRLGETSVLTLSAELVSGEFLPGAPDQLAAAVDLLADYAVAPRLQDGGFPPDVFAREHALAKALAAAVFDDKNAWARQRALACACAGEPYGIPDHGGDEALSAVDRFAPVEALDDFLRRGRLWCVAMGSIPEDLPDRIEPLLSSFPESSPEVVPRPACPDRRATRRAREAAEARQARSVMSFRIPAPRDAAELCAQHAFASLFGGGPHSLLFKEVREKRSLVYHIGAGLDPHKGILIVQSGTDGAALDEVETEVERQLRRIAEGSFADAELAAAIETLCGAVTAVDDSLAGRMHFTAEQFLLGFDQDPDQRRESYRAVGRGDVARAAGSAWLDHCYALVPEGRE
ncbi:MAG: pitrilysin family protein [Planctomycetota bacterium]